MYSLLHVRRDVRLLPRVSRKCRCYQCGAYTIDILHLIGIGNGSHILKYACFDFHTECSTMIPFLSFIRGLDTRQINKSVLMIVEKL